jgi:flagellar biosynthesis protein FlhB
MADKPDSDSKTEHPTAKRKADAAREGDLLQSRELGSALGVAAAAAWLALAGPAMIEASEAMLASGLRLDRQDLAGFDPSVAAVRLVSIVALPLAILFALSIAAAIAGPAILGSAGFRAGPLAFKGRRIDPLKGVARMFGLQGLIELAKSVAKTALLGAIGYWLLMGDLGRLAGLARSDPHVASAEIGGMLSFAIVALAAGFLAIALIDVPVQVRQRMTRLRMTKQELKEELRQSDGAPELKHAQRQRMHAVLSGSARKAIGEATVVLTNPSHFAVALRYDPMRDHAPVVVARGRDEAAQAVKALAGANNVPMLEYPQLTRAIYFTSRPGQIIESDLYIAVATILAFVFNIDRAMAEGIAQPHVDVPLAKHYDERGTRLHPG